MSKLKSSSVKKSLIITDVNEKVYSLLPSITNKKHDDMLVLSSFGAVISQPYGCLMRSILLALYQEKNIEEVFIVGVSDNKEMKLNQEDLLRKIKDIGVSEDIINTINYIDAAGQDVINWLVGQQNINDVMKKNIDLITRHPLFPKSIPVYAYIANLEKGEYYSF